MENNPLNNFGNLIIKPNNYKQKVNEKKPSKKKQMLNIGLFLTNGKDLTITSGFLPRKNRTKNCILYSLKLCRNCRIKNIYLTEQKKGGRKNE